MAVYIIPGFFRKKDFYNKLLVRLRQDGLQAEIIDLGLNTGGLEDGAQKVLQYLEKTKEKDDIIAHSFGGLLLKQILLVKPQMRKQINSISFTAVPHQGSWAALLVPVWPAALHMLPFSKKLRKNSEALLPENTMNFLPGKEYKIWPRRSSRLEGFVDTVITGTDHDSIIHSEEFARRVIEFIKTSFPEKTEY